MNSTSSLPSSVPSSSSAIMQAPWLVSQPVITDAGLGGDILHLGPKAEKIFERDARPRVLYVAAGTVTVEINATNFMLKGDAVLPVPADRALTVRNHGDAPAKVLVLVLPAPRVEWRLFVPEGMELKTQP